MIILKLVKQKNKTRAICEGLETGRRTSIYISCSHKQSYFCWRFSDSAFLIGGIDRTETVVLNSTVKMAGFFILIVIVLTAALPLNLSFPASHGSNRASFFTLDLCNKAGSFALSALDICTLCEKKYELLRQVFTGLHTIANPIFYLYQSVSLMDHPPQA